MRAFPSTLMIIIESENRGVSRNRNSFFQMVSLHKKDSSQGKVFKTLVPIVFTFHISSLAEQYIAY